ncbi:hypothetical protein CC85DRAFT_150988 [Cutaneotrichosporon oleaginosum]|uniref:Uncharacterized protein n=1 Tax=Cutaneotrichosporon oleaginosum TaxID=879819 RepID=A0A0J0XHB8_9TREE|nr:uncharacterized protein CC85DRAFT_150988 [Cutaneotrichosporon oleaginosum]KLT40397.1 hypothetical protein CC85DRAFT_150988 [Cutaneotrichosporon oleaginosum]TXT11362.1 hypothetical protein COLE_01772 [Cutaneotrichosporon oleaginosum]
MSAPATALELELASAPPHSFLGLGGAAPAHLRLDVRDLEDSWSDLAAYFATQLPASNGLYAAPSTGCSAADAADLEALLYGVYRRVHSTLCGTRRLEVGDSVLAPHDYSFLSSFSTREGQEFKDTRVFNLYRALAPPSPEGSRRIDKPNYILYAEVTDDGDVWSVGEGMGEVVLGPRRGDVERWLDAHAWSKPEGIARDVAADNYRYDVAMATRTFRDFMARTGLAHSLFHLLAANEMCGAVLAWAVIGHKLVRMYVLGPSRIAIEVTPPRSANFTRTPHIPPHEREGIPYASLETTRAFDRLPHSFLAPDDPSVFPPGPRLNPNALQAFANVAAASVLRLGALDCTAALRPLATARQGGVAADMAAVLGELSPLPPELCRYIVELSRGATLRRVASPAAQPHPQVQAQAEESAGGLGLAGHGVELAPPATLTPNPDAAPRKRRASEAAEGIERATARARTPVSADVSGGRRSPLRIESPEPETEHEHRPLDEHDFDHMPPIVPGQRARGGIDWDSLDAVLDRLAVFVPVTPGEMDALVAAQIEEDSAPYRPSTGFTASPAAMDMEEEEGEEEETPLRSLADEYDSDAESIVD